MPGDGAHHRAGLQLVDDFHAAGHSRQTCGGPYLPPVGAARIARQTRHSNQTTVEITSMHSKAPLIAKALTKVSGFLKRIKENAEQFSQALRWKLILSAAFQKFLRGRVLGSPHMPAEVTG